MGGFQYLLYPLPTANLMVLTDRKQCATEFPIPVLCLIPPSFIRPSLILDESPLSCI
jgi:hypothetical protein